MKKLSLLLIAGVSLVFTSCATLDAIHRVSKIIDVSNELKEEFSAGAPKESVTKKSEETTYIEVAEAIINASETIDNEDSYIIGRAVSSSILGNYKLYENKAASEYVNKVLAVIVKNSPNPYLYKGYFIAILDTDEVNAISSPGGHIFITRGLLQKASSEDEVAAVIAHEVSHIQLGHAIQSIKTSRIMDATNKVLEVSLKDKNHKYTENEITAFNETRKEIVTTLVNSGFSKSQEFDADANALELMLSSGYDPNCMNNLLETLEENSTEPGWNKTHPKPSNRIKKIQKKLKTINFKGASKEVRQKRFEAVKRYF